MAIWNYRAELIPRAWIIREYGGIPPVLDQEESLDVALDRNPNLLNEVQASRWEGMYCPSDFILRAEAILPATKKTNSFVCCGSPGSHRIELWIQDALPDLLEIKLDLRQPNLELFERIVEYAHYLDALIVPDDRYTAVHSSMESLLADLLLSRAYKFCKDPHGWLAEFAAQNEAKTHKNTKGDG